MKAIVYFLSTLFLFQLLLVSCSPSNPDNKANTDSKQAMKQHDSKSALKGTIDGAICYPSDYIPAMTLYARNAKTGETFSKSLAEETDHYQITVPPGTYKVFVWADGIGGSYSKAVPCGLSVNCTNHTLILISVKPSQTVFGVNPCDFYSQKDIPKP
jgi:hypothetical protein